MSLTADCNSLMLATARTALSDRLDRRRAGRPERYQRRLARILERTGWPILVALSQWVYGSRP